MKLKATLMALPMAAALATPAFADINVGVIASLTGPAAAATETKKTVALFPSTIGVKRSILLFSTMAPTPPARSRTCAKLIF